MLLTDERLSVIWLPNTIRAVSLLIFHSGLFLTFFLVYFRKGYGRVEKFIDVDLKEKAHFTNQEYQEKHICGHPDQIIFSEGDSRSSTAIWGGFLLLYIILVLLSKNVAITKFIICLVILIVFIPIILLCSRETQLIFHKSKRALYQWRKHRWFPFLNRCMSYKYEDIQKVWLTWDMEVSKTAKYYSILKVKIKAPYVKDLISYSVDTSSSAIEMAELEETFERANRLAVYGKMIQQDIEKWDRDHEGKLDAVDIDDDGDEIMTAVDQTQNNDGDGVVDLDMDMVGAINAWDANANGDGIKDVKIKGLLDMPVISDFAKGLYIASLINQEMKSPLNELTVYEDGGSMHFMFVFLIWFGSGCLVLIVFVLLTLLYGWF
ncbi:MAG: hypothetical protein ACKO7R_17670 [Pseudanabaena sp.]